MDDSKAVQAWFELVDSVRGHMQPSQYEDWKFMTGYSGTPHERYLAGLMALETIRPGVGQIVQHQIERSLNGKSKD